MKGHYVTLNEHIRLTSSSSHEEIFLFRKNINTPEILQRLLLLFIQAE